MKKNMGFLDRVVRLCIAGVIAALYFMNIISGSLAIALGIFALVFSLTSLFSFCPLYAMVGWDTCEVKQG